LTFIEKKKRRDLRREGKREETFIEKKETFVEKEETFVENKKTFIEKEETFVEKGNEEFAKVGLCPSVEFWIL
jgi:hypothetical protein